MKPPLSLVLVLSLAAVSNWSCQGREARATAEAAAPDVCTTALAAGSERDEADRQIARLQRQARDERRSRQSLEQLGYRYVARARARHDAGDYVLAEKAAECLSVRYPDDASALLLRGHAMHQLHRFSEAEQIARSLVKRRGLALDYGLLGDALMEQGRLAEAADAYQAMIDLKPFYQSYTRAAHLRWLRGDLEGAIELMRMAVASASPRDPESIAWAYTRLAAYELQHGRPNEAARAVNAALTHRPEYAAALLTRGRILLASRRYDEGRDVLRRAARLNPLPEYQWALADALRLAGNQAEAEAVEDGLVTEGGRADARTLALFFATRKTAAARAVALAQGEMAARTDVFTLDALAWSLAAAGRVDEAAPIMDRALSEGTQDGRLFLHAAAIAAAAGRLAEARRWAARAKDLQLTLLPSELAALRAVQKAISHRQEN